MSIVGSCMTIAELGNRLDMRDSRVTFLLEDYFLPDNRDYLLPIGKLEKSGMKQIIGNSANPGRRAFGEYVANFVGGNYIHLSGSQIDELSKENWEQMEGSFPINSVRSSAVYLYACALSKKLRYFDLNEKKLWTEHGIINPYEMDQTVLLLGDTESFVDGELVGKPENDEEAEKQIRRLLTGEPYTMISAQVATWHGIARGAGVSIHMTHVRVDPNLSDRERNNLYIVWRDLYERGDVPLTPGAASASNPELWHYVMVHVPNRMSDLVTSLEGVRNPNYEKMNWQAVDNLEGDTQREMIANLMGAAPRGFAEALVNLEKETAEIDRRMKAMEQHVEQSHGIMLDQIAVALLGTS